LFGTPGQFFADQTVVSGVQLCPSSQKADDQEHNYLLLNSPSTTFPARSQTLLNYASLKVLTITSDASQYDSCFRQSGNNLEIKKPAIPSQQPL
jgi:hypothetical protein